MKALKIILVSVSIGVLLFVGVAMRPTVNQDFPTPDGDLAPTLSADLPPDTRASLQWTDAEPLPAADPEWGTKVSAESFEWVQRVIKPEMLPKTPEFKVAEISYAKREGEPPVVYDGTRMKCQSAGGTLFVTQTVGKLFVVFRPVDDAPGARLLTPKELRIYLEELVQRLFKHASVMLYLSHEERFVDGFSLGLDMERTISSHDEVAAAVAALDSELRDPLRGPIDSYYWGSSFFCTDGRDVVATFYKVLGGKVSEIDRPKW